VGRPLNRSAIHWIRVIVSIETMRRLTRILFNEAAGDPGVPFERGRQQTRVSSIVSSD
jgi:hypothetical protein